MHETEVCHPERSTHETEVCHPEHSKHETEVCHPERSEGSLIFLKRKQGFLVASLLGMTAMVLS